METVTALLPYLTPDERAEMDALLRESSQIPQTDDELWDYVAQTWGVRIPRVAVCPGHVAPFKVYADAFFARSSVIVLKASRGLGGKSFLLAYLALTQGHMLGVSVTLLGGSFMQASRVHEYMRKAWEFPGAPRHELRSDPTANKTRFANGAEVEVLTGSEKSSRGPHPCRAIQDEADEMDLRVHEAAMGQAMPQRGVGGREFPACTVISSTHQHPDGTFTAILKKAKEKAWPSYEYCYRETMEPHGWLAASTVEQKRNDMTVVQWQTEVEGQEPSPESRAIDPPAVAAMFRRDLGEYQGAPREYIEHEPPVEGATYAHGADWAKTQDWTELVSFRTDVMPIRLVAYERMQRLPWPTMVGRFEARLLRYRNPGGMTAPACFDGTGLGDVVAGYLSVEAEGVIMVGRARADLFSNYISVIERAGIVSPYIESLESQHRYCSVNDLYGSGHPPDGFVAGSLAYRASGLMLHAESISPEEQEAIWREVEAEARREAAQQRALPAPAPEPDEEPRDQGRPRFHAARPPRWGLSRPR